MPVKNARVRSVSIEIEDHGFTTAWLNLDYGGSGQGFGGHPLGRENEPHKRCALFVRRCMEVVGVLQWECIAGQVIRVQVEDGLVVAIGHALEDKWFNPSEEFAQLKED